MNVTVLRMEKPVSHVEEGIILRTIAELLHEEFRESISTDGGCDDNAFRILPLHRTSFSEHVYTCPEFVPVSQGVSCGWPLHIARDPRVETSCCTDAPVLLCDWLAWLQSPSDLIASVVSYGWAARFEYGVPSTSEPVRIQFLLLVYYANPKGLAAGLPYQLSLSSPGSYRFLQHFQRGHLTEGNAGWRIDAQTAIFIASIKSGWALSKKECDHNLTPY